MKSNELLRLLRQNGWYEVRQNGSHIIMQHDTNLTQLTVPNHGTKEVKKGLLRAILKQTNITTNKR